jgi:hypothetical protein
MNLSDATLALMTKNAAILFKDVPTLEEIEKLREMLNGTADMIILEKLNEQHSR